MAEIELNTVGGSPESVPNGYAPASPLIGWNEIFFSELRSRDDGMQWEVYDRTSVWPIRKHRIHTN